MKAVYPQQMRDPSNVFKDAVDELFQGAMVALNSSNDIVFAMRTLNSLNDIP